MNLTVIRNRKCLIVGGLLVLNSVLLPNNTAIAQQYAETGVDMRLQRVSEHVYYVQGEAGVATDNEGFISNATAIITGEGIVVVDALGHTFVGRIVSEKTKSD